MILTLTFKALKTLQFESLSLTADVWRQHATFINPDHNQMLRAPTIVSCNRSNPSNNGECATKYRQTIRTGFIKEFVLIQQIHTVNTNSLMQPVRIVWPFFSQFLLLFVHILRLNILRLRKRRWASWINCKLKLQRTLRLKATVPTKRREIGSIAISKSTQTFKYWHTVKLVENGYKFT